MSRRIILSVAGLFISKLGRDAASANPDDLLFSDAKGASRLFMKGTLTGSLTYARVADYGPGTLGYEYHVPHNLGYIPYFRGYNSGPTGKIMVDASNVILSLLQFNPPANPPSTMVVTDHNAYFEVFYDRWV